MLDFLDNDVFTIAPDKNIARAQVNRTGPALLRDVERVFGSCSDLFAVHNDMDQFIRLVYEGLYDLLQPLLSGFRIFGIYQVTSWTLSDLVESLFNCQST